MTNNFWVDFSCQYALFALNKFGEPAFIGLHQIIASLDPIIFSNICIGLVGFFIIGVIVASKYIGKKN